MTQEEPYRQIVDLSPDAIMIHSAGRIVYANPAAAALLGAEDPYRIVGMRALDIVHPDYRQIVRERMRAEEAGDQAPLLEEVFVRLDGTTVDVEVSGKPFTYAGRPAGQIIARDISRRKATEGRLREAESRYRAIVETLPAVVYLETAEEHFETLYISPQVEEILGLSQEAYIRDPDYWVDHLHPDDRERAVAEFASYLDTGSPQVLQYRMITEDGRVIWCEDRQVMLRDEAGRPVAIQGIMADVSDQRVAELAVRRRDEILAAVDVAAKALLRADRWEDVITDVLQALGEAARVSGVTIWETEERDGQVFSDLTYEWSAPGGTPHMDDPETHGVALDDIWDDWTALMRARTTLVGLAADRPEGERDWYLAAQMVSILDVPIFVEGVWWGVIGFEDRVEREWPAGEVEALQAAAETLGAAISRQRTHQRLRETEQRYRALVEQIPAVLYMDRPGAEDETIYISPQVEEILGLSAKAWLRDPGLWYRHLHPEDQEYAMLTFRRGVAAGTPFSYEYRMVTPRGVMWIRDDAVVLPSEDGVPIVQGVMFDITEEKLAEQALLESESRERDAAQQLRQLDLMKNTFLAAVSHELRSPLTSVLGLALTLEAQDLPRSEQVDLLHRLAANARKLQRLLADLLDIDRLSRGVITPQRHTTDVGALVQGTVAAADFLGDRVIKVEAESVIATVDGAKVERIVENLLVNATRHTPEGTTVWVRVQPHDDGVLITVEDNGPGVPEELRASVFEAFSQGPSPASATPGTGIGLTLVQRFAELHGGRVWLEDRAGGGASFKVFLPTGKEAGFVL